MNLDIRTYGVNNNNKISKSNNKNSKVRKKYRNENGIRETLWCSKPHSYEDNSSRFNKTVSEINKDTIFNNTTKKKITNNKKKITNIN